MRQIISDFNHHKAAQYPVASVAATWPQLQAGDIVDVVAPAWACKRSELNGAVRYLKKMGFRARVPKNIFSKKVKLFAQTDQERLLQLTRALSAPDSKAVWCLRGGYGAIRLLPGLTKLKIPSQTKLVIGYSDITTLHTFLNAQWRWPTIHGPLLDRFGRHANLPQETKETWGLLTGNLDHVVFKNLKPLNLAARKTKNIRSSVIGGNMAVLQSSLSTPWQANPNGHIVFFEDVGERPHRVDRMLTQFQQAGFFKKTKAVLFGSLLVANNKDRRLMITDVLPRFAQSVKFPVLMNMPCGHGDVQRPLPFLTAATLTTGKNSQLVVAGA